MLRLTLSTAVWSPKLLVTASMTICGLAAGSSHGRSARGFEALEIMAAASEIRRRRRAPPLRRVERPLHHARAHHAPLPKELPVEIDVGPTGRAGREMRRLHHGERDVALGCRRPGGGSHAPHFLAARALRVEQRIVR